MIPPSAPHNCFGKALLAEGGWASLPSISSVSAPGADVGYGIHSKFFVLQARKLFPQFWWELGIWRALCMFHWHKNISCFKDTLVETRNVSSAICTRINYRTSRELCPEDAAGCGTQAEAASAPAGTGPAAPESCSQTRSVLRRQHHPKSKLLCHITARAPTLHHHQGESCSSTILSAPPTSLRDILVKILSWRLRYVFSTKCNTNSNSRFPPPCWDR